MKDKISLAFQRKDFFSKTLALTIIFYLFKTAFWPLTYLFIVGYAILFFLLLKSFDWKFRFPKLFSDFKPPLILAGIFMFSFLINRNFSNIVAKKDILLIAILFSLSFFVYWNNMHYKSGISKSFTFNSIIYTAAIIAVLNLVLQLFPSLLPSEFQSKLHISDGSAIGNDYNFFCLILLFGLILINFKSPDNALDISYSRVLKFILNLVFILSIILSSSRRGIIMLAFLLVVKFLYSIVINFKSFSLKFSIKEGIKIFGIICFFFIAGIMIYNNVPRQKLSAVLYRYSNIFGIGNNISIESYLWNREQLLPKDKKYLIDGSSFVKGLNYWKEGSAPGTTISNVTTTYGSGIKVSREKGDNGGFSLCYCGPKIIYYANHTYKISFKIKFLKGDFNSFNVGWWVNDGEKGYDNTVGLEKDIVEIGNGWYTCCSRYSFIDNHIDLIGFINSVKNNTSFLIVDFELIDLNLNSKLPRYVFEVTKKDNIDAFLAKSNPPFFGPSLINNGNFASGLTFWKWTTNASIDVNLAFIDGKECCRISRSKGDGGGFSLYYVGRNIEFKANNNYQIAFKLKLISPKTIPFAVGYWINEGEGYKNELKLKIDTLLNGWLDIKANYLFKKDHTNLLFPINSQISNSSFYITDINLLNLTQHQYQANPILMSGDSTKNVAHIEDTINKDTFFSSRTTRWSYAAELWKIKYKWYNKLFGRGFEYYELFGQKFHNDPVHGDWPHNPFISVLLYSGIFGLIFYIWFLYKTISLYILYRKEYTIFFIGFLMTFFFSFFSGSSPFDPPIMGFFMLLPFFLHSAHKNGNNTCTNK